MAIEKQQVQSPMEAERTRNRRVFVPPVDIFEAKDATVLLADMPGVDEKSVNIALDKNILTIRGTVEPKQYKGYSCVYNEYDVGDYKRAFSISDDVDKDKIEATVKNGILRLTLPKSEPAKAKKIPVKVE